jgi:hypothetical protein
MGRKKGKGMRKGRVAIGPKRLHCEQNWMHSGRRENVIFGRGGRYQNIDLHIDILLCILNS